MFGKFWTLVILTLAHQSDGSPIDAREYVVTESLIHTNRSISLPQYLASIPADFRISNDLELPIRFPPEACFTNIIAALTNVAVGDFRGKMPVSNYRTTRFPQPLIKMNSPGLRDVPRQFMAWGLYLVAFYLRSHNKYNMSFFSLQWKGEEIAGIGMAATPGVAAIQNSSLEISSPNDGVKVDFAFYGGALELGMGAAFMTIIASLLEVAPQATEAIIYETVINFLHTEPATFVVTPTAVARGPRGPYFTNKVLIEALSRTADFFAASNDYRQLGLNISVDGIMVAQGAFVQRRFLRSLSFLDAVETEKRGLQTAYSGLQ
ncbi:MAG: hypothetical protein Q9169_004956 [Polycauliona sp. 2 TL-2023]